MQFLEIAKHGIVLHQKIGYKKEQFKLEEGRERVIRLYMYILYKLVFNWFVDLWRESREPHAIRCVKKKNSESMILSPLRLVNFDMPGVVLVVVVVVNLLFILLFILLLSLMQLKLLMMLLLLLFFLLL